MQNSRRYDPTKETKFNVSIATTEASAQHPAPSGRNRGTVPPRRITDQSQ
jgi:hypothetical protein